MDHGMASRPNSHIILLVCTLSLILLFTGCIEHHFIYDFDQDGNCSFSYQAKGDSLDIYDPPGSFPTEPFYNISTKTSVDTSGTETHILEASARFCSDSLPRTLGLKEVPWADVFLKHPTHLGTTPLFFFNIYRFECVFLGRQRTNLDGERWQYIPEECRQLEAENDTTISDAERAVLEEKYAGGMIIWNTERFKRRMHEIVEYTLAKHPELDLPQQWIDSALVELDIYVQTYASEKEMVNLDLSSLEWWDDLAPTAHSIISENLNFIGDSTLKADLAHVGEILELRHQVTEDLMDESFIVRALLPGKLVSTNADSIELGANQWEFEGEEIADDDKVMEATSILVFYDRIAGILVLLLAVILAIKFKRTGKDSPRAEGPHAPTSPHDSIPPTGHG